MTATLPWNAPARSPVQQWRADAHALLMARLRERYGAQAEALAVPLMLALNDVTATLAPYPTTPRG